MCPVLLFADDTVLLSDNEWELQLAGSSEHVWSSVRKTELEGKWGRAKLWSLKEGQPQTVR